MNKNTLICFLFILLVINNTKVQINFSVVDKKNRNINGALIIIKDCNDYSFNKITTSSKGRCRIENLLKNRYEILVYKKGYIVRRFILNVLNNINCKIKLSLRKVNRLYGIISNKKGDEPIENAIVVLYRVICNKIYFPIRFTYTDFNGEYNFINIPKGKYIVKSIK